MPFKEQKFFAALREVFVGAKVEGESGFVNLMRIKARYYERGVFPRLKADIESALAPFPEFREEFFDRLYTFFRRYFSESGSIYFRFTPPHEHVYEKVYTDDRDVALFWKTHMLYYVKTDRLFRSMAVEVDGFRFFFDVSTLEHKRANEKRALIYTFKERREDGTLVFTVTYSEKGRKTRFGDLRKAIRDALGLKKYTAQVPYEEALERAFRLFERQSEVDYFINKDARRFLREQFNLWLYQYVFEPEERQGTIWTERRIKQLQALKEIAYKIIDFIAQFEDELVRIWNKPKFVLGSHYVITLDRIAAREGGLAVLKRLLAHPGMEAQVQEWRDLGMVGEDFTPEQVWVEDGESQRLHERYQYLPLDTRHFPDLETTIPSLFDHLDRELDGWLVHSENYQALNTMLPKFRERVKCVYIDPPYNTGSDEFVYRDQFRHSSWLTMMENRLRLAREWMREDGVIFVSIDDGEQDVLRKVMETVFETENFVNNVVWQKKFSPQNDARWLSDNHDFLVTFAKNKELWRPGLLPRTERQNRRYQNPDNDPRGPWMSSDLSVKTYSPEYDYPITTPSGRVVYPPPGRCWAVPREKMMELIADNRIWFGSDGNGVPRLKRFLSETKQGVTPLTIWTYKEVGHNQEGKQELKRMLTESEEVFGTPKPTRLLQRVITVGSSRETKVLILDFFAGSGTTAHAVINLNREDGGKRKYILVEMADYFHAVLLPRIKKVVFSDQWKDGKAQEGGQGVSHFIKYFRLEQYEEVLRKARYRDDDAPLFFQDDPYTQYVFLRDPKMLDNAETGEKVMEIDPREDEIRVNLDRLYPDIDLAETLSCLTGKWIRRIHPTEDDPTRPGRVEFEDGTTVDLQNPPWEMVKPLIWW